MNWVDYGWSKRKDVYTSRFDSLKLYSTIVDYAELFEELADGNETIYELKMVVFAYFERQKAAVAEMLAFM